MPGSVHSSLFPLYLLLLPTKVGGKTDLDGKHRSQMSARIRNMVHELKPRGTESDCFGHVNHGAAILPFTILKARLGASFRCKFYSDSPGGSRDIGLKTQKFGRQSRKQVRIRSGCSVPCDVFLTNMAMHPLTFVTGTPLTVGCSNGHKATA